MLAWALQFYSRLGNATRDAIDENRFLRNFDLMGVQRHLKAAGIFASIAEQVASLAYQVGLGEPVLFDGGPSRSRALSKALESRLGCPLAVPPCGEFVTALGAAVMRGV